MTTSSYLPSRSSGFRMMHIHFIVLNPVICSFLLRTVFPGEPCGGQCPIGQLDLWSFFRPTHSPVCERRVCGGWAPHPATLYTHRLRMKLRQSVGVATYCLGLFTDHSWITAVHYVPEFRHGALRKRTSHRKHRKMRYRGNRGRGRGGLPAEHGAQRRAQSQDPGIVT